MIPQSKWEWYGYPAHFICANDCRFRLATKVGNYIISTVGDLHYEHEKDRRRTLGSGDDSFFETYVFKAGARCGPPCGCNEARLADACEIEGIRTPTAKKARETHMKLCKKYARRK